MFDNKPFTTEVSTQDCHEGDARGCAASRPIYVVGTVVLITLLAFALRTQHLLTIPPGFNYDEAAHAMDALEVLQGHLTVWSARSGGNPMLFMYFIAASFGLLGAHPFAQRLVVVFLSTATIPALYLLAKTMFRRYGRKRAQFIGVLAALGLATSFWHLNHSRMGLEFNPAPCFEVLSFYFMWRALLDRRRWFALISGFWLGLALYVYPTARFVPLLLLLFFVYLWWVGERQDDKRDGRIRLQRLVVPLALIALGATIVFAPIGVHFLLNPADFFGRAGDTVFLNPVVSQGDPWPRLLQGASANIGAFGFTTDENALANVPGRSLLDPALAALFWAGLLWSVYRFKRPPYAFCVLWWAVMLVPVILAPDRFPHFGRLISTAPVVYILIAVTLDQLWHGLTRLTATKPPLCRAVRIILGGAIVLAYGTSAVSAYQDYFYTWATSRNTYEDFYGPTVELADLMNADTSTDAVYVLPCNTRPPACDYYTLDFCHRDGVPYYAIRMNEWEVPEKLTQVSADKTLVKLIHLKIGKRKFEIEEADPKRILDFLLERYGRLEAVETYPAYDIRHYRLPSPGTDFTAVASAERLDAAFGGQLRLRTAAFGDASGPATSTAQRVPSGGILWALLEWEALGEAGENYKASLRLRDGAGHLIAQRDHPLQDNTQDPTTRWKPKDGTVPDYYLLPIPYTTPPGEYTIEVVVYSPDSLAPLPVDGVAGAVSATLGGVQIVPPQTISATVEIEAGSPLSATITPEIAIAGYDLDSSQPYSPGGQGTMALYWHVTGTPATDLDWHLTLRDAGHEWLLIQAVPPLGAQFPTSQWTAGQLWKALYDFRVPVDVPTGTYDAVGHFTNDVGQRVGSEVAFGAIDVAGRPRHFEMPAMDHTIGADFGDKIRLLGYDVYPGPLQPDGELAVVLHWQALATMDTSYTTFVQLLDENGTLRAQRDAIPGDGTLPTTGWAPDEVISDRLAVPLGVDLAAGQYTPVVGIYDAFTGQRLPVSGDAGRPAGDYVALEAVTVE